jgi:Spy/CpxP family protein refolding chaperone
MNARFLSRSLLPFAAILLCGSMALSQQAPAPPTPPASTDTPVTAPTPPAPIERQPPASGMRGPQAPRPPHPMHGRPAMEPMMREHGMHEGPMGGSIGFGMERKWWKDDYIAQQINLTPEQIKRMDTIFEQSKLQLIDMRATLQKQEVLLEPLLSANPVDTTRTMAQIDKVAQARADLEKANAKMLLRIRGVLTPEQWTKLNERHGRRRDGFEQPPAHGVPPAPVGPGTVR